MAAVAPADISPPTATLDITAGMPFRSDNVTTGFTEALPQVSLPCASGRTDPCLCAARATSLRLRFLATSFGGSANAGCRMQSSEPRSHNFFRVRKHRSPRSRLHRNRIFPCEEGRPEKLQDSLCTSSSGLCQAPEFAVRGRQCRSSSLQSASAIWRSDCRSAVQPWNADFRLLLAL